MNVENIWSKISSSYYMRQYIHRRMLTTRSNIKQDQNFLTRIFKFPEYNEHFSPSNTFRKYKRLQLNEITLSGRLQ
jgi:hypothetical protein